MASPLVTEFGSKSPNQLLVSVLAGSWRSLPTAFECSVPELEELTPMLRASGVAALCWRRIKSSTLRELPAATILHNLYRANTLRAALYQQTIKQVIARFRSVGIEPILVKGWAAARLYPEEGLRPYGDIDLCIRPAEFSLAETALDSLTENQWKVDLHSGFATLGGGDVDEIYARSHLVQLGETTVRVPSSEDHLRILCIHFLREGGWRPLWLCDIAAAVESLPADFDWAYCLGVNRRQADSLICAIKLAHHLLGAEISGTPANQRRSSLPRWLVPTILKEWGSPSPSMSNRHRAPMASYFRYPSGIVQGLRHRWPNPIEATISMRGPFNDLPRLPFQLGNCLARTAKFAASLPKRLRDH